MKTRRCFVLEEVEIEFEDLLPGEIFRLEAEGDYIANEYYKATARPSRFIPQGNFVSNGNIVVQCEHTGFRTDGPIKELVRK